MKSVEEIKAKLQKLFAMMEEGSGASEQEVQTAMIKAKRLMAEYKLSEDDVKDCKKVDEVIKVCVSEVSFSTNVNPWVISLLNVVADNYCCHPVVYTTYGAKTKSAGLIGFEEDVQMAKTVLKYAYESILNGFKVDVKELERKARIRAYNNNYEYKPMTSSDKTSARNAYGNGYVEGIREAFAEEKKVEEAIGTALVMCVPQEVKDVAEGLHKSKFNSSNATRKARMFDDFAVKGYAEGKNFSTRTRIAQEDIIIIER